MDDPQDAEARVTEIVASCWDRLSAGESVDEDAVVRANPDVADALRRRFEALHRLERAFRRDPAPAAPSLAGTTLGAYRVEAVVGSGGMGTVYRAVVAGRVPGFAAGDRVALKVVHPHLLAREGFFRRFVREAEIGRRVRHVNVVRTFDAEAVPCEGGHHHFLVMEYVEGQTLRSLLDEVERVPEKLCRHIGRETAKALAAIHEAGAVHRDLKPENVLITGDDVVKVMDFGVARMDDDAARLSQTGAFVGSVLYAAPEQFGGLDARLDGRTDLYALGLVLYELATSHHPFAGGDFRTVFRRQMHEDPRPAGERNPQVSALFEELLRTLVAKDRDGRIATAAELASILTDGERSEWWATRAAAIRAESRRPLRRVRIPRETALHGRDAELAHLRSLYEQAAAGDGRVVLVEGEAGIGKSRLVDEFVGRLHQAGEDVNFLFGSYPPGGAATSSGAFSTAYREQFGGSDLETTLTSYLSATPLLIPAFAALLRGDVAPPGAEPLSKDSVQTVFVHATRALAAERPTIVLIDDLHFAPEEGRALFAALALAVPGHRILLVGTARPGVDETWLGNLERHRHVARLPLPRLGPKDLARLLVDALRSERLAEELAYRIGAKSDGNPYFVFEILRGLKEGRFLTPKPDGTWVTTQVLQDIQIPSTIRDLVAARIADLAPEDKDLLDVASCLGFEFDAGVVAEALGEAHVPVLRRLARIEARHRLVRSAGERFVFDHHQVQESLYAGLPPPLAREYHAAIAAAIETRSGAAAKEPKVVDGALCVELAGHWARGARRERLERYLDAALGHLERSNRHAAAIELAECVLAQPDLVSGTRRGDVVLRRARALGLTGRTDDEADAVEEAVASADASGDSASRVRARAARAAHLFRTGRIDAAIEELRNQLALAREFADRRGEIDAVGRLGGVLYAAGRYRESRDCLESHVHMARESGDRLGLARSIGNLGLVHAESGEFEEASDRHEQAMALFREIGDRRGEAAALTNLGALCHARGRFAEERGFHERQLAISRDIGDRRGEATAAGNLGLVLDVDGYSVESRASYDRQLALAREIGDRCLEATALFNRALLFASLGAAADARGDLLQTLELRRADGDRPGVGYSLHGLGWAALQADDPIAASEHLADALALRREIGDLRGVADSLAELAVSLRERQRPGEAIALLDESLVLLRDLGVPAMTVVVSAERAVLPGADVRAAQDLLAAHGPGLAVENRMRAHWLLWRATSDRVHLEQARSILRHVVDHAPAELRESAVRGVRMHREIAAAADHGT
jgi:serine/threonine protein kinase/tetratricopeptide (TPR) repeat protein